MATRYKHKDDDDDDDDEDGAAAAAAAQALLAPPSLCIAFKLPDEDECIDEEYMEVKKEQRERIIGKLRDLNLNVEQRINRGKDTLFLNVSADESILKQQAEARGIRCKLLEEKYGGAMCMYSSALDDNKDRQCFAEAADDASELPFTSLMQLEMTDRIVRSAPVDDADGDGAIDPESLMQSRPSEDGEDDEEPEIIGYFYMHFDRERAKLGVEWAASFTQPQPLERIRVYFGEKVALFFTFYGFYMTMLWLPSLWGLWLFVTQCQSRPQTQSWENPNVMVYSIAMSVWAVLVSQLWKRLEGERRYEWDTLEFEDQETELLEFKSHPETLKGVHVNETTEEKDDFYFDEGSLLPPRGRKARVLTSMLYICALCGLSGCLSVWIYTLCQPLMKQGDTTFGASILGGLYTAQGHILSMLFRQLLAWRMFQENWRTETEREDALIMRLATFKLFNAYFGIFFIAFVANRIPWAPGLRCPGWQCLPVLQGTFTSMMVFDFLYRILRDKGMPSALKWWRENNPWGTEVLKKKAQGVSVRLPMEEQLDMQKPREIVEYYEDIVVQFGYIAMFGASFPLVGVISLGLNVIYLRTHAVDLLQNQQRPPYRCASDIGAWQDVINLIALMAVITNAGLCGLTGHVVYFYYPNLSFVDRLWFVAVLEHVMLIIKILLENLISPDPERAIDEYNLRQVKKMALLEQVGIEEDHCKVE